MKFKDRLIGILQLFICVAVPGTIYSSFKLSGHPLGGLETLALYAPFVCFYLRAEFKRKQLKSSQAPKDESTPITPEMLAAVASDDTPKTEEPMTREERLKDIDTCLQKAISDCAQGKISAKEFADICALLRQVENEPSISAQEAVKSSQHPSTEESYLIEDDNGFLVRVPADKLDSWAAADHNAPLTPAEKQFIENLLDSLYHKTTVENKQSTTKSKAIRDFNQPKMTPPPEQDRTIEKPIGCIPNSGYAPIPWWRSTNVLARLALGLIAAALICAVIFAVVPGLPDPTAAVSPPPAVSVNIPPDPSESLSIQERLDRMKQDGETQKARDNLSDPLPAPDSGKIFYENKHIGDRIAPLTIDASGQSSFTGYYVKLRQAKTKIPVLNFYVGGGNEAKVYVPLGTYELLYASGYSFSWYGQDSLFGPDTSYYRADDFFSFYEEDGYVNGWTVTLSKQYNGNLDVDEISADQF